MLREIDLPQEAELPLAQEEKNLLQSAKMTTLVTQNQESLCFNIPNEQRNGIENSEGNLLFSKQHEKTLYQSPEDQDDKQQPSNEAFAKLKELELKSSRVITMFPHLHSRSFQSRMGQSRTEGAIEDPQMSNKIKIIKELEQNIYQLESGMVDRTTGQDFIANIQKEIKKNFDHYYTQTRQFKRPLQKIDTKEKQNSERQEVMNKSQESYKLQFQNIEFQGQKSQLNTSRRRSQGDGRSSMGKIIEDFDIKVENHRFQYENNESFAADNNESVSSISAFQLPLDSLEKTRGDEDKFQGYFQKRTDRSNFSSTSELDKIREQIWNRNLLEFNPDELCQVQQLDQKSESQHDLSQQLELQSRLESQNKKSLEENAILRKQIEEKKVEIEKANEKSKQFESKALSKQIQLLELNDKQQEIEADNRQLKVKVSELEIQLEKEEEEQKLLKQRISSLEKKLTVVLEQKQNESHEFMKVIHDKSEDIEDVTRVNQELKNILSKKQQIFQAQLQDAETQITDLKEEIKYYKLQLEEEGFHFNIEQASAIRDMLQDQSESEQVSLKYNKIVSTLKKEQQILKKSIEELREKNKQLSRNALTIGERHEEIELQIKQLLSQDTECNQNKKEENSTCHSINSIALEEKGKEDEKDFHFLIGVSRIIQKLKFCQGNLAREKNQKHKITDKLKGLNLYVNKEIEKVEQKSSRLQKENSKYKRQNQELSSELRKIQLRMKNMKNRFSKNPMASLQQLQNEMLQLQNKKLLDQWKKAKKYGEELQKKLTEKITEKPLYEQLFSFICDNRKEEQEEKEKNQTEFDKIKSSLMEEYSKSQIVVSQFSETPSRESKNIALASKVFSFMSRPPKFLPKSILAPLPILSAVAEKPSSTTLDKLLLKKSWWTADFKTKFICKLFSLCIELIKVTRKLFSLKPCEMVVSGESTVQIVIRRQFAEGKEEDDDSLLYRAPEVLLGFAESEASYVWSVGIIMDQVLHSKSFYKKINQILSRKENYEVRDSQLAVKDILQKMLKKNHKERPSLEQARASFLSLC